MIATIGKLEEFQPENEKISSYLEQLELYLTANDVADGKKVAVLLSVIGVKTYSLLCDLLSPANPKDKSFAQLSEALKNHFEPKPMVIAERFTFYCRDQYPNESILEYVAELRVFTVNSKGSWIRL